MIKLREPDNLQFCVLLAETCDKFSRSPAEYLFNDLECAHTKLVIDMVVYDIYATWREKIETQARKKQELRNAHRKQSLP